MEYEEKEVGGEGGGERANERCIRCFERGSLTAITLPALEEVPDVDEDEYLNLIMSQSTTFLTERAGVVVVSC